MRYHQSIDNCLAESVGAAGLSADAYGAMLDETRPGLEKLRGWSRDGSLPFLALPGRRDDLDVLTPVIEDYRFSFRDILIFGAGGSSLGGRSLCALAVAGDGPRLHFMENVDPHGFDSVFRRLDLSNTGVLAISKSGGTPETVSQLVACLARFRDAVGGDAMARHVTIITEPTDNPLRRLAGRFALSALAHDPKIGGRYSALSLVGLLPAAIVGLDIGAVRDGAAEVLDAALADGDPKDCAPAVGAAVSLGLARHGGIGATVMMPYIDRLAPFARWHRQIWAESLGKGGQGTTPIDALGTVDQHSQLQLWLDGPNDKMFTIFAGPTAGAGDLIAPKFTGADTALDWLTGRRLGDLLDCSCRATVDALVARGRPVRLFTLESVDEAALGALMMHFMLETIIAADMMGVDPFDQPAVEDGKILARKYMESLMDNRR